MLLLESIGSSCSDPGLMSVLAVVKRILSFIQIVGPIIAIVSLTIHIVMLVKNPDDKKGIPRIRNSIIALVVLFLLPSIINAFFVMLDDTTVISSCWNDAELQIHAGGGNYVSPYENEKEKKSSFYTDPEEYQKGDPKQNSSSSSGGTSAGDRQGVGNTSASRVVFIGDSRTVQMYVYLGNGSWGTANYSSGGVHVVGNDIYVAEGAMGLSWMKSTGIPAAQSYFTSGTAIVILMGVNDLYNADNYISYINSNASQWKSNGSSLYFVSTNPCTGDYAFLNDDIVSFNAKVKSGLSDQVGWIDTHSELSRIGFQSGDGLHYEASTYRTIYNYIKSKV